MWPKITQKQKKIFFRYYPVFGHIFETYDFFRVHHVNQRIKLPLGASFEKVSKIFVFCRKFRQKCRKFKTRPFRQGMRYWLETYRDYCPYLRLSTRQKSGHLLERLWSYGHLKKSQNFDIFDRHSTMVENFQKPSLSKIRWTLGYRMVKR